MRKLDYWRKGKQWEVNIVDTFTGEHIIIDNDMMYDKPSKPRTSEQYLALEDVQRMIESDKPLYTFSMA